MERNTSIRNNARRTSDGIAERRQETVVRVPERSAIIRRENARQSEIAIRQSAPVIQPERTQRQTQRINRIPVNTASSQVQPDSNLVVVKKVQALVGDTLWRIALRNNVRTINIVYVNQLSNPDVIFPGQTINIPNK